MTTATADSLTLPNSDEPLSLQLPDSLLALRERALALQRQPQPRLPELTLADGRSWAAHTGDEDWLIWRARRCAERLGSMPLDLEPGERIVGKPLLREPAEEERPQLEEAQRTLATMPPFPGGDAGHFHPPLPVAPSSLRQSPLCRPRTASRSPDESARCPRLGKEGSPQALPASHPPPQPPLLSGTAAPADRPPAPPPAARSASPRDGRPSVGRARSASPPPYRAPPRSGRRSGAASARRESPPAAAPAPRFAAPRLPASASATAVRQKRERQRQRAVQICRHRMSSKCSPNNHRRVDASHS